jgi:hypothetical protein
MLIIAPQYCTTKESTPLEPIQSYPASMTRIGYRQYMISISHHHKAFRHTLTSLFSITLSKSSVPHIRDPDFFLKKKETMTTPPPSTFSQIPILPLSHALDAETKPAFLASLRHALLNVGFLYLSELGLPAQLLQDVKRECVGFFQDLPLEEKERIEMKNQKSFLGWSRVSFV